MWRLSGCKAVTPAASAALPAKSAASGPGKYTREYAQCCITSTDLCGQSIVQKYASAYTHNALLRHEVK